MRFLNDLVMNALDASVNETSAAIDASQLLTASFHVVTAGSNPNGALKIQASNDLPTNGAPTNWVDIASQTVSTTNNGGYLIPKFDVSYQYLRAVFTASSGTGTITVRMKANAF